MNEPRSERDGETLKEAKMLCLCVVWAPPLGSGPHRLSMAAGDKQAVHTTVGSHLIHSPHSTGFCESAQWKRQALVRRDRMTDESPLTSRSLTAHTPHKQASSAAATLIPVPRPMRVDLDKAMRAQKWPAGSGWDQDAIGWDQTGSDGIGWERMGLDGIRRSGSGKMKWDYSGVGMGMDMGMGMGIRVWVCVWAWAWVWVWVWVWVGHGHGHG
jgi:hypothetical protein